MKLYKCTFSAKSSSGVNILNFWVYLVKYRA